MSNVRPRMRDLCDIVRPPETLRAASPRPSGARSIRQREDLTTSVVPGFRSSATTGLSSRSRVPRESLAPLPEPAPTVIRLGAASSASKERDLLRDGALAFESPRGLRTETRLLVEALPKRSPGRALFGMDTEGATALAARTLWPQTACSWFHLDAYVAEKVRGVLKRNSADGVEVAVGEDPPEGPFDVVALPFPKAGEALLMRDLLEAAHDSLAAGGRLVAATDGKPDALRRTIDKVFGNVTNAAARGTRGACFYAERRRAKTVRSDHSHVVRAAIAHADGTGETSLDIETRPGTFSHGAVDKGTRALAEWLEPRNAAHVLDLGAGCGLLGLYAALPLPAAPVGLVDRN